MPVTLQISPEEYLSTSFEGTDKEYVHGEVIERSMPTWSHGRLQGEIVRQFGNLPESCRLYAGTEVRMELAPDVFRIPDVAVFAGSPPAKEVPDVPPLVAIEIISADDRLSAVIEKFQEYREWGVEHIWGMDPQLRKMYVYHGQGLTIVSVLTLPGYPLELTSLFE